MIIINTSPLISLASIDQLSIIDRIFPEWCIPESVFNECIKADKPYASMLESFLKNKIKKVQNKNAALNLSLLIDKGEAEVIQLAKENKSRFIVIDDKKGRNIAQLNGLDVIGTVGLLLNGKRKGYVDAIKPLLENLQKNGIRLSETLIQVALELADEK